MLSILVCSAAPLYTGQPPRNGKVQGCGCDDWQNAAAAAMTALEGAPWHERLRKALAALPRERRRELRAYARPAEADSLLRPEEAGAALLDLASNDYLGLSRHPAVRAAAAAELESSGLGAGASRLVSGTRPVHLALEAALAAWLGRQRVLLFPSGFQANLAAVNALADRHSLVLADRLIHHSLLAGARLSGARLQRFAHNNLADLERRLSQARRERPEGPLLVLCESIYSMEGTSAPVRELAALCARHGAPLLVDEAHALGVIGPAGRGLAHGLVEVALVSGTFGKAFGSGGAFLAADEPLGEWLLQSSGAFRYSTALAPPLAAGALAALELLRAEPQAGAALCRRAERWRDGLEAAGWPRPPGAGPILPLLVGDDGEALALQQRLEAAGLLTVAIRPPTVPEGTARLRLVLRRDLPTGSLERLLGALGSGPKFVCRGG
jgi:8-amino-7-oxononanoate synthase